jgi:hypothetical protein
MARTAAVLGILLLLAVPFRGIVSAQTPPPAAPSTPATAADVAALKQSLEQLHAELAALSRRIGVIEQELHAIESR